jgi:FlaA1/EpsC-like NDP-sugar epimerase
MIRLSGFEPDVDINVVYTGLRPGEKLYEELLMGEEGLSRTASDLIYIGQKIDFDSSLLQQELAAIRQLEEGQEDLLRHHIKMLVPTYVFPSETVSV